ncbi:hypothetical protein KR018_005354 [Drosophila ironensis]|nr:hypothetical protein KR018_005354 [Drosophila ironensis]
MVLAERNATDVVRNGRRSRGPSPNTHTTTTATTTATATAGASLANSTTLAGNGSGVGGGGPNHSSNPGVNEKVATAAPGAGTPESSDDDNSTKRNGKAKAKQSEYEEKIRVGRDYQAVCPPLVPEVDRRPELMNERALLVWSPTKEIPDLKLEEYISVAKEKYGYNGEQALGMLFWHKHDLERAVMDLANFTPFPDEWTIEDKVLFEQAFQFHGKSFHRIRQMLPDKSIASLVKYYYSWKKTRHRSSAMDRQEKPIKAAVKDGSENGSEVGSNEESDNDDKKGLGNAAATSNAANTNSNGGNTNNNSNTANTTTNNNNTNNDNINNNMNNNITNNCVNNNGNGNNISNNTISNNSGDNSNTEENNNNGNASNSSSNNSNTDIEAEQLCIFPSNVHGDEVLGFVLSAEGFATNGTVSTYNVGDTAGDSSSPRRVVVGGFCKTCNVVCHVLFDSSLGRMCKSCHTHWRRTGNRRPISGPESNAPRRSTHSNAAAADRSKRKPPKGMYINHDDLTALASCRNSSVYLAERDRKISALMAEIQKNRQTMEQLDKECNTINVEETVVKSATAVAETVTAQPRCSGRWTQDEIQVALLALREYGKNYPMVAKLVTTKTEAHVRTFYLNNRRRYNLDQIVKEYEAGKSEDSGAEDHTESITDGAAATSSAAVTSTPNVVDSSPMAVKAVVDDDNNDVDSSQEALAKKEDKKKSDLVMGITNSAGSEGSSGANSSSTTIVGSTATDATSDAPIKKSSSAMITITDESDTATNSSSEVITPVTAADGTGSTSLIKSVLSSDEPSSVKSIAAGGAVVPSSAVSISNKRDSSALVGSSLINSP